MKLAILQTDVLHPEFLQQYHGYGSMFQQMFASAGIAVESEIFSVIEGIYPQEPEVFDAMLVTGSKADAYSELPWINTLSDYLRSRYAAGQKLLGICFGHQLLAHALGGKAQRAENGWGVGVMDYQWCHRPQWLHANTNDFKLICSHRDQVTQLPEGATLLASNDFCPIAAFNIGDLVLTFQGHPEFVPEYGKALLEKRRVDIGEQKTAQALISYQQPHDGLAIAAVMADFILA
ncbi:amidotransferase [Shewanella yunxiaonensis]|uniref:Amidotransferase n=1 Tax=Shewanella yunxiaonensis TaxID=2829809 RepID=A0ABX7YSR8_9GAMM|nr:MULTISPECIES: amidotransferase [Shewanella]MDF0534103.1 amidotransferase [Shewanella sp. A32]QUN05420.1 amidotransferase [Shewanella yunxiaonensis]